MLTVGLINGLHKVVDIHALVNVQVERKSLGWGEDVGVDFFEFAGSHQVRFKFCGFQGKVGIKNAAFTIGVWDYCLLIDLGDLANELLGDLSGIVHFGIPSSIEIGGDVVLIKAKSV